MRKFRKIFIEYNNLFCAYLTDLNGIVFLEPHKWIKFVRCLIVCTYSLKFKGNQGNIINCVSSALYNNTLCGGDL